MDALLKRAWWALLIGGVASVIFGVLAFVWPGLTLLILALFFAASVLVDGVAMLVGAFKNRGSASHSWLWILLGCSASSPVASACFLRPPAAGALLLLISAYAIVAGVLMIWAGFKLREQIEREWLLWLLGGLSVLFGVLMVVQPAAGVLGLVWAIASWAIVNGVLKIMLAFKARSFGSRLQTPGPAAT